MSVYDHDRAEAQGITLTTRNADPESRIAGWVENVTVTARAYVICPSDLSLRSAVAALQGLETALRDAEALRVLTVQRAAV